MSLVQNCELDRDTEPHFTQPVRYIYEYIDVMIQGGDAAISTVRKTQGTCNSALKCASWRSHGQRSVRSVTSQAPLDGNNWRQMDPGVRAIAPCEYPVLARYCLPSGRQLVMLFSESPILRNIPRKTVDGGKIKPGKGAPETTDLS